jgi:hypothetical protein
MNMRTHPTRRGGFTLVELLVAAALTILIMSILAGAFSAALGSLSLLRSVGTMAERLRSTHTQLNEDLNAAHFDAGDSTSSLRVSDIRYDLLTPSGREASPPPGGFFFIRQADGSVYEGLDQDGVFSTRATGTAGHVLGMTVRRTGKTQDQLFTVDLNPLITYANNAGNPAAQRAQAAQIVIELNSQSVSDVVGTPTNVPNPTNFAQTVTLRTVYAANWAEVYWFLNPNGQQLGGVTNHSLHRRTRVLTVTPISTVFPTAVAPFDAILADLFQSLSVHPVGPNILTNTTDTIRVPGNRLYAAPGTNPSPIPSMSSKYGDDIVLSNVISFEVKATWSAGPQWQKTVGPSTFIYAQPQSIRPFARPAVVASTVILPAVVVGNSIQFGTPTVAGTVNDATNGDSPFDDLPVRNGLNPTNPLRPENIGNETANTPGPYNGPTGNGTRVFDSWYPATTPASGPNPATNWFTPGSTDTIPFRARITGVKIKIRLFDVKTQQTRQSTLIVDL